MDNKKPPGRLKRLWRFLRKPKVFISIGVFGIAVILWMVFLPPFRFYTYFTTIESTVELVELTQEDVQHPASEVMGADIIHRASGEVSFVERGGSTFLRYTNLDMTNGPQLEVWLAASCCDRGSITSDYVVVGPIQGTRGDFEYEIPAGTDLSKYRFAVHWCVPFSVLFNHAELNLTQ